ncbi:MAG: hypothetical protein WCL29_09305, partial [Pseudomonadota bacterium]
MQLYLEAVRFLHDQGLPEGQFSGQAGLANYDSFVYAVNEIKNPAGEVIGFIAGAKNDSLKGTFKNDVLVGGPGNDVLIGDVGNDLLMGGDGNDTYRFVVSSDNGIVVSLDVIFWGNDTIADSGGTDSIQIVGTGIVGIGVRDLQAKEQANGDVTITVRASSNTSATITIKDYFGIGHIENLYLGSARTTIDDLLAGNTFVYPSLSQIVANAGAVAAHIAADAAVVVANAALAAAQLAATTA